MDRILEKFGLKYEDLKPQERETLNSWLESLENNKLTLEKVREYVSEMREQVLIENAKVSTNSKEDLFQKARIKNYTLLIALLSAPDKARKAIEAQLGNIKKVI